MVKVDFESLNETRLEAGFFVREVCEMLGISERTWYRWQRSEKAPKWSYLALRTLSGRLDFLGWRGWYIERGVLYTEKHSPKLYNWKPEDLTVWRFCQVRQ